MAAFCALSACLPSPPPPLRSLSICHLALALSVFFTLTWLRCFGNADNISCASAVQQLATQLATAAPALLQQRLVRRPTSSFAGNSTDSLLLHAMLLCSCSCLGPLLWQPQSSTVLFVLLYEHTHATSAHTRTHTHIIHSLSSCEIR